MRKFNDLISVIIPVYNGDNYLRKAIESVLNQTYDNIELILVDDGATKKCIDIMEDYAKNDKRVVLIHEKNKGASFARNVGLDACKGKYIAFLDEDDYYTRDILETLYLALVKNRCQMAMCNFYGTDSTLAVDNRVKKIDALKYFKNIYLGNFHSFIWNRLYKAELLKDIRFENEKQEDILFTTKAVIKAGRLVYVNSCLVHHIPRKGSITDIMETEYLFSWVKAVMQRNELLKNEYPELNQLIIIDYLKTIKDIMDVAIRKGREDLYNSETFMNSYKIYKDMYKKNKYIMPKKGLSNYNLFYSNIKLYIFITKIKNIFKK